MSTKDKLISAVHTPGPWQADKWAPGFTVSAPNSHYSICHLEDCNNDAANARLIAAAPDLLEACQAVLQTLEVDSDLKVIRNGCMVNLDFTGLRDKLRQAISKGGGE